MGLFRSKFWVIIVAVMVLAMAGCQSSARSTATPSQTPMPTASNTQPAPNNPNAAHSSPSLVPFGVSPTPTGPFTGILIKHPVFDARGVEYFVRSTRYDDLPEEVQLWAINTKILNRSTVSGNTDSWFDMDSSSYPSIFPKGQEELDAVMALVKPLETSFSMDIKSSNADNITFTLYLYASGDNMTIKAKEVDLRLTEDYTVRLETSYDLEIAITDGDTITYRASDEGAHAEFVVPFNCTIKIAPSQ